MTLMLELCADLSAHASFIKSDDLGHITRRSSIFAAILNETLNIDRDNVFRTKVVENKFHI
jgi:hypothetical protein